MTTDRRKNDWAAVKLIEVAGKIVVQEEERRGTMRLSRVKKCVSRLNFVNKKCVDRLVNFVDAMPPSQPQCAIQPQPKESHEWTISNIATPIIWQKPHAKYDDTCDVGSHKRDDRTNIQTKKGQEQIIVIYSKFCKDNLSTHTKKNSRI